MPRVNLTPTTVVGPYPTLPVAANSLDIPFTAADATNFNQFPLTGRELVIARNSGATGRTITFTSVADDLKRSGDIGPYSIEAGDMIAFFVSQMPGWRQSDGNMYLQASHAEVLIAVIRLP